ncbi:hypothetical protein CSV86_016900 [Pseudomonas putida CSV86]|uniref:Uncharacterized protein n=1 Tax=Pseudomonas bharatica CSV86 TaxID=1005395 RepID=A0A7K4EGF6_9PSED|nr:hypothetical protein [Pseudomonas bharatica]NNJ16762.1 hypothetical protein [Pseudomonas bharatica CSV86]
MESLGILPNQEVFFRVSLDQPITDIEALANYLKRRIIVLFAGALAETLSARHDTQNRGVNHSKAFEIFHSPFLGAVQDNARVSEALIVLRNVQSRTPCSAQEVDLEITEIGNRMWTRAISLVEKFEDVIVGVADRLTQDLQVVDPVWSQTIGASLSEEDLAGIPILQMLPLLDP